MTWQPISTAPKDGTQILVISQRGFYSVAAWCSEKRGPGVSGHIQQPGWIGWVNGEEVRDEGWDTGHGFALELKDKDVPILWMPLPPPPGEER